jgi:uncharacterized membrane protein
MRALAYLSRWVEFIGLAVWVGGMVSLGALVAPIVFTTVKPIEMAGAAMSLVFRRFNGGLVYACIAMVWIGFLGKLFLDKNRNRSRWVEGGLIAVMILVGLYIGTILGPQMEDLRHTRITDPSNSAAIVQFDRDHRISETLFTVNLILGLAVLFINAKESAAQNFDGDAGRRPDGPRPA